MDKVDNKVQRLRRRCVLLVTFEIVVIGGCLPKVDKKLVRNLSCVQ